MALVHVSPEKILNVRTLLRKEISMTHFKPSITIALLMLSALCHGEDSIRPKVSEILMGYVAKLRSVGPISVNYAYSKIGADDQPLLIKKTHFSTNGSKNFFLRVASTPKIEKDANFECFALDGSGIFFLNSGFDRVLFSHFDVPARPAPIDKETRRKFPFIRLRTSGMQDSSFGDAPLNPMLAGMEWIALLDRYCRGEEYGRYARWCDIYDDKLIDFIGKNLLTITSSDENTITMEANNPLSKKFYNTGETPQYQFTFKKYSDKNGASFFRIEKIRRFTFWDVRSRPTRVSVYDDGGRERIEIDYDDATGVIPIGIRTTLEVDKETRKLADVKADAPKPISEKEFNEDLSTVKYSDFSIYDIETKMIIGE